MEERLEEMRKGEMRKGRRERIEKGSHCFFKSSGYDIECIIKKKDMSWCETVCKNMCHW